MSDDSKFYKMAAPDGENSSGYHMSAQDKKSEPDGQKFKMNSDKKGEGKSMKE